jgi:hypothetical protein
MDARRGCAAFSVAGIENGQEFNRAEAEANCRRHKHSPGGSEGEGEMDRVTPNRPDGRIAGRHPDRKRSIAQTHPERSGGRGLEDCRRGPRNSRRNIAELPGFWAARAHTPSNRLGLAIPL